MYLIALIHSLRLLIICETAKFRTLDQCDKLSNLLSTKISDSSMLDQQPYPEISKNLQIV